VRGGAVRFDAPHASECLAVAEGIETALSISVARAMPVWAALSAGGIKNLILPPEVTNVVVCADNDASATGQRAAHDAAARWLAEGRRVRVAMPPESSTDFNDVLTGRVVTKGKVGKQNGDPVVPKAKGDFHRGEVPKHALS